MRFHFSSGSTFEHGIGYARSIVGRDRIFVSGTTGVDYASGTISSDVVSRRGSASSTSRSLRVRPASISETSSASVTSCPSGMTSRHASPCCGTVFRHGAPGRGDDRGRPRRPAHENRDRSHWPPPRGLSFGYAAWR